MNAVLEAQHAMTSLQLGIRGRFESPTDPGQSPGAGPGRKDPLRRYSTAYISQKYTLGVHLHQITILCILLIKVTNSSTEAAVISIIASLCVTLDKENLVCQLAN